MLLVPLASCCGALLAFEGGVRPFLDRSPTAWRALGTRELPPRPIVPFPRSPDFDADRPVPGLTFRGEVLTQGDLSGVFREDPEIGYVWAPSRASRHGWWRSNALGARADRETPAGVPPGRSRVLVFGDSFAAGTRLPGWQTWAAGLQALRPDLDVVNFGVDGYGMGQSTLLYRRVRERVDWDLALFLFVPWESLWRDVNVSRWIGDGWASYTPMPRFEVHEDGVRLVPPPYDEVAAVYRRNWPQVSPELRAHLRAHDRFYEPLLFESPPVLGSLVSWKLWALHRAGERREALRKRIGNDLDGEAFTICRRLLRQAVDEAQAQGRRGVVAVLPVPAEVRGMRNDPAACARWQNVLACLRESGVRVVDLAPALVEAPAGDLDAGADGSHYGPRASRRIAAALAEALPSP